MEKEITFKVNDRVVYPTHGVGIILAEEIEMIGDIEIRVFVIMFPKDKMTLRVPVKRSKAVGLRNLIDKSELDKVLDVLTSKARSSRGMWSKRAQDLENRLNSGNALSVAEVVRDLHINSLDPDRSYSERILYDSALNRLASEVAAIMDFEHKDAIEYLLDLLSERQAA